MNLGIALASSAILENAMYTAELLRVTGRTEELDCFLGVVAERVST